MSQEHVREHIDLIEKHEQEFLARRSRAERVPDSVASYVGSFTFVLVHVVLFHESLTTE